MIHHLEVTCHCCGIEHMYGNKEQIDHVEEAVKNAPTTISYRRWVEEDVDYEL